MVVQLICVKSGPWSTHVEQTLYLSCLIFSNSESLSIHDTFTTMQPIIVHATAIFCCQIVWMNSKKMQPVWVTNESSFIKMSHDTFKCYLKKYLGRTDCVQKHCSQQCLWGSLSHVHKKHSIIALSLCERWMYQTQTFSVTSQEREVVVSICSKYVTG